MGKMIIKLKSSFDDMSFQSYLTLCHSMVYNLPGSSPGKEYWSGLPCLPPGDLPNSGIEPASLTSPALAGGFFTTITTWKASNLVLEVSY